MRRWRLGVLLTAFVLVTALPLAGLAAWLAGTSSAQQAALINAQNIDKVRAVSTAIDLEIERTMGELVTLTTLDPIDSSDLAHFTQIAARLIPLHPGWHSVRLIDPTLRVVANTDPAGPSTLVEPEWARKMFAEGKRGTSTVRRDPAGYWVVNVGVPVVRGGTVRYILAARLRADALREVLRRQDPPDGGVLTLLDSQPVIIARTRNEDRFVGGSPTADFVERSRSAPFGSWRTVLLEGTPAYSAWYRSSLTGWTVGLGMPSEVIDGPLRRRMTAIIVTAAVTLSAGLFVALLLGRSIVRAQVAAGASARALARGEPLPRVRSYIAEADDLGAALSDAAAILEQRIRERDAAADALNRAKDNFIATVSHELRTPLNAIYGWVAMLRTGSLDADRQARALDVIERNARAQSQVVEDLLDMTSVIHGRLRLNIEPVDLSAAVRSAADIILPSADERRTRIAITATAPAWVAGDPSRIRQIVWNLLANAMKFSRPGGRIDVEVTSTPEHAVLRVRDDGEGIAPEFLPHVFDRFRQETETVTRQHSGLGIGLALAKTLVEMHGGTIEAHSAGKETGATFTVRLPRCEDARETAAP